MGELHELILRDGIEAARLRAESKTQRHAVEAAAQLLAEEESRLGITHAGFAMTSLPHKRISDPFWKRQGNRTTLLVESGRDRQGELIGVPYGSLARLILLYLQTEAVRTGNPEVELGRSMKAWMTRMSLSAGGKTYQLVGEQARRISGCRLTFFTDLTTAELRSNGAFRPEQHLPGRVGGPASANAVAGPRAARRRVLAFPQGNTRFPCARKR